jgi:hypothetical protein
MATGFVVSVHVADEQYGSPEPVYSFLVFTVEGLHRVNMGGPMTRQEEYVENAVESLELAERLASSSDRRRMLKLAEAWVELANGTHDRGPPPHMHDHALAKVEPSGYHRDW